MNFKKFLSLTTATFMAVSALAVNAFAATPTPENCTMVVTTRVEGDAADTQENFIFTIAIPGDVPAEREFTVSKTGTPQSSQIHANESCSVILKHSENFTINGPANTAIKIVQSNNTGYNIRFLKTGSDGAPGETVESNEFNSATFNGTLTFTNTKNAPAATPGVTKVTGDPIYTVNATLISNKEDSTAVAPNIGVDVTLSPATAEQVSGEIKQGLQFTNSEGAPINPSVMVAFNNEDGTTQFVDGKLTKTGQFDMTDVHFPSAGIYRYVMNMSDGYVGSAGNVAAGITGYNTKTLYLDIYVENDGDNTKIAYFVTSIPGEDGSVTKSEGFEINYSSFDLSLTNNTTGSAGDKGKDFTYTVKFDPNTIKGYYLMADEDNTDNYTLVDDTTCTVTLKHGGVINFLNVPKGAKYEITGSSAEGYTTTITAAGDDVSGEIDNTTYKFKELVDGINGDTQVTYTNNKEGVLPTGVILATIIPTIVGVTAIGGIGAFIVVKKKDNDSEEEE